MNVHGSWENIALMLDLPMNTPLKQLFDELAKRWDRFPVSPVVVDSAPLKEIIIKNKDLYHPNFKLSEDKISQMIDKPMLPPLGKLINP